MTDEERYYSGSDHDSENEIPDSIMYCILAVLGMFSYLCYYLLEHVQ